MTSSQTAEQPVGKELQDYRIYGSRNVKHYRVYGEPEKYSQQYERDPYSLKQNLLYKRAMFGLGIYKPEEVKAMHYQKRKRIKAVHKRAQKILNIWKQELTNLWTNRFFEVVFPKSPFTKELSEGSQIVDPEFKNTLSFQDLGVSKEDVIQKLMDEGVLPPDFKSL